MCVCVPIHFVKFLEFILNAIYTNNEPTGPLYLQTNMLKYLMLFHVPYF